jgi:hypothetical protein
MHSFARNECVYGNPCPSVCLHVSPPNLLKWYTWDFGIQKSPAKSSRTNLILNFINPLQHLLYMSTTSYGLDDRVVGVPSPGRVKNFLFSKSSRPALRSTQPPIQWVPGALSPGVKRPGREVDRSPPTSAEVKKMRIYTSTPHTPSWRSA